MEENILVNKTEQDYCFPLSEDLGC